MTVSRWAGLFLPLAAWASQGWNVVEQPDLQARLEAAPPARVESLGVAIRSVQPWPCTLAPHADRRGWDVLQWYFKDYMHGTRAYIVDTTTGRVSRQDFPEAEGRIRPDSTAWQLAPDGRFYGATPDWGKGGGMLLYFYDPAAKRLVLRDRVPALVGEANPLVLSPDGRMYGTGTYLDSHKVGAYCFDPRAGKVVRDYGPLGPSHAPSTAFGYFMGVDDTHMYIASGKVPWYLLAVEIRTGRETVLFEAAPGDYMERMRITPRFPGAVAWVRKDDADRGREYWLYHGAAIPKMNDTPPWPVRPSPWDSVAPRPEVYSGQLDPDPEGRAVLWYRTGGDPSAGWKPARIEGIETYPLPIHRLIRLPDGRLFGTAPAYKGRFVFDPATGRSVPLGRGGASPYAFLVHGGKLYWSGYSSAPIYEYDPVRPWTLEKGGPPGHPAPEQTSPESNPRLVANVFRETRVKKVMSAAAGADGKIYFGGIGQRDYEGGGLGWYNPQTRETGGMWKPFSGYGIYWLTPALGARLLVISTRARPDELNGGRKPPQAKLFVYDVRASRLVREIEPVAGAEKAGPLVEVAPGRLLGTTEDPETPGGGVLYGVDVNSGQVLFRKRLPRTLRFPWTQGTAQWDFQKGPDGFVWTMLGDVLVRIDPADARVEPVGRLSPAGKFTFVGSDLYLAGTEQMRRIAAAAVR